ncbi:MAG: hypothetical protein IH921_11295, partial [Gemmatimonadetes bacterium]|nr:hypothetical protein [Gemmatimonadota bacterium]
FETNAGDGFWVVHPLAQGSDSVYRYQSGDTLSLALPDGRVLQTIQLDVLPREADIHRISGSLWIEPETGALVRAVYRLSRQFDAMRDVAELQEEEEAGSFRFVPGLFKPWTFDLTMVAVEYSLWDFEVWLPRSMRIEGEVAAGILKMPVSMDVSYRMESVTTRSDLAREETAQEAGLEERHFETRAEAMDFIAQLLSERDGIEYERVSLNDESPSNREQLMIAPQDRSLVDTSPHLPPPIWEEAVGFPSDDQLEDYFNTLAALPAPTIQGVPWAANWGWDRPDLLRYNRVEGPALGGRFEADLGGPYTLDASGFFGFADLKPKARLNFQRSTVRRRLTLGGYYELQATDPRGRYLGFGNSVYAFLFGRDDGEYYRAMGMDFTWGPPVGARESFEFRAYAERQESVPVETSFALFQAFDASFAFRPNVDADEVEEVGAELRLSPWWGGEASGTQWGLDLYGQGARWRTTGGSTGTNYGRASVTLRMAIPLVPRLWRLGLEAGVGTTFGDAPLQRQWFLGGATTLRGYPASSARGSSFARSRVEVARTFYEIGSVSFFGDVGWAGLRGDFNGDDLLYGIGVGGSLLDLPDLAARLTNFLADFSRPRPVMVCGGGPTVELIRRWDREFDLGEVLRVTFKIAERTVVAIGRVAWATELDPITTDVGVEFLQVDSEVLDLLEEIAPSEVAV